MWNNNPWHNNYNNHNNYDDHNDGYHSYIKKPTKYSLGVYQIWSYEYPIPKAHAAKGGELKDRPGIILDRGYELDDLRDDPSVWKDPQYGPIFVYATTNPTLADKVARQNASLDIGDGYIYVGYDMYKAFGFAKPCTLNFYASNQSMQESAFSAQELETNGTYLGTLSDEAIRYLLKFREPLEKKFNITLLTVEQFHQEQKKEEEVRNQLLALDEAYTGFHQKAVDKINDLIEDIYDLRKRGMESEAGEYSIKNLIFKEFRNLGYLDNLKELRKKEISKELSLESLKEELIDYSNEDEINSKTKEIMDIISQQLNEPFIYYTSLDYLSYGEMIEGCDYKDLVKLVVPYIISNDTEYNVYFTDDLGWSASNDYIITKKTISLQDLYRSIKKTIEEQGDETLSQKEFEDHVFTIDEDGNYKNVKIN